MIIFTIWSQEGIAGGECPWLLSAIDEYANDESGLPDDYRAALTNPDCRELRIKISDKAVHALFEAPTISGRVVDDATDALRAKVRQLALDHPLTDRHALSKSHIFYAPWMEPFGAKGIGNFPDEAFANYRASVEQLVKNASERDLQLWLERFQWIT